jgi:hypothetical protein
LKDSVVILFVAPNLPIMGIPTYQNSRGMP